MTSRPAARALTAASLAGLQQPLHGRRQTRHQVGIMQTREAGFEKLGGRDRSVDATPGKKRGQA